MKTTTPVWERQDAETNKSFYFFCIYRNMGSVRSLALVVAENNMNKHYVRQLETWSKQHNWVERVTAYDAFIQSQRISTLVNGEQLLIASDFETLIAVNREILTRLQENPDEYTPSQLLSMSSNLYRRYRQKTSELIGGNGGHWYKLRFTVFQRDGFTCKYCGQSPQKDGVSLHVDHIRARSKGGDNSLSNLITSCHICNLGKGDVLLEQRLEEKMRQQI